MLKAKWETNKLFKQISKQSLSECEAMDYAATEKQVPLLIDALKHKDPKVRGTSALILSKTSAVSKLANPLIESLNDPDQWVRERVMDALGVVKSRDAVLPLIKALKNIDALEKADRRRAASFIIDEEKHILGALYEIDSVEAIREMIAYFQGGYFSNGRKISIVRALCEIGDQKCHEIYVDLLEDNFFKNIRSLIFAALKRTEYPGFLEKIEHYFITDNFMHLSEGMREKKSVLNLLVDLDDDSVDDLLVKWLVAFNSETRKEVADVLRQRGDEKWSQLVKGTHADFEKLVQTKDKRIIEPLIKTYAAVDPSMGGSVSFLYESELEVILKAIPGLDSREAPPFIVAAIEDPATDVSKKRALLLALKKIDYLAVNKFISRVSEDEEADPAIKEAVNAALIEMDLDKDSDYLIGLLGKEHPKKLEIIEELGKRKYKKAVDAIYDFLFDADGAYRLAASVALRDLGVKSPVEITGKDQEIIALSKTGDVRAARALKDLMVSPRYDSHRRKEFALALIALAKKKKDKSLLDDEIKAIITTPHSDMVVGRKTEHGDVAEASQCKHGVGHGDHIYVVSPGTHTDTGIGLEVDDF